MTSILYSRLALIAGLVCLPMTSALAKVSPKPVLNKLCTCEVDYRDADQLTGEPACNITCSDAEGNILPDLGSYSNPLDGMNGPNDCINQAQKVQTLATKSGYLCELVRG